MPDDPWEQHAAWWQQGFTDGADPEYEEQILPLATRYLTGAHRVLDVVKTADWVVDLGPEGGDGGGRVVAEGAPEVIAKVPESHTGRYLAGVLGGAAKTAEPEEVPAVSRRRRK